jgi:hypothetical protein
MTRHNTTLGFEIEFLRNANINRVIEGCEQGGVKVSDQRTRYNTEFYADRWVQAYDCSCGWEIKSNPITETSEVETVMRAIRQAGGSVNRNCGLHVHMDVSSMTHEQRIKLVKTYLRHERAMIELLPRSRRGSTQYASDNTLRVSVDDRTWASLDQAMTVDDLARIAQPRGRYSKLNIGAFRKHGTFEFRGHQGTLNFKKIDAWASLLGAMYNAAMDDRFDPLPLASTFDEMLGELLPYSAASRTARTYKRPAAGTKTGAVWTVADSLPTTHPELFENHDGRVVLRSLAETAALISVMTGVALGTCKTQLGRWSATNGYSRRVGTNENVLASYLRRRREGLA